MIEFFNKRDSRKKKDDEEEIRVGQVYAIPQDAKKISIETNKTTDLLQELNSTNDKYDAIDKILEKTPDGKMALNTYLRIANQGVDIQLVNASTGRPLKKYDQELRSFCAHMGGNTADGLDGLIDQLHTSSIAHGGMACEVVVAPGADEIESVIIIDPKTITDFEWLEDKKRYAAYQKGQGANKVDLYDGNFFWIPHQPKPGHPDGTLQFEPAITTMTEYYQLIQDSLVVLNRIGFPKYDVSIDMEKLIESATPEEKSDPKKLNKRINDTFREISSGMRSMSRDSNLVHFNSFTVDVIGGGLNGSGIDVRAWYEMLEPLIVNSFQLTPVLLGRLKSGSYSLGTAEYKIVKDNIEVLRRASKRMLENIINLWARVKGYNVYAVVKHKPIEWQIEKEKFEAQLLKMQRARRAEEYRYVDHEEASLLAMGDEADPQEVNPDLYEYVNKNLSGASGTEEDQKQEEGDNVNEESN